MTGIKEVESLAIEAGAFQEGDPDYNHYLELLRQAEVAAWRARDQLLVMVRNAENRAATANVSPPLK